MTDKKLERMITRLRYHLSLVRKDCKDRGSYDGEYFEKLWRIDNHAESGLNTLIDLEKFLVDVGFLIVQNRGKRDVR